MAGKRVEQLRAVAPDVCPICLVNVEAANGSLHVRDISDYRAEAVNPPAGVTG